MRRKELEMPPTGGCCEVQLWNVHVPTMTSGEVLLWCLEFIWWDVPQLRDLQQKKSMILAI